MSTSQGSSGSLADLPPEVIQEQAEMEALLEEERLKELFKCRDSPEGTKVVAYVKSEDEKWRSARIKHP